jgi:hypothetical protein
MARSNQWIEFVRMYAKHFGLSYMCAISSQDIKQDYKDWKAGKVEFGSTKYRNGKELKSKKPKTKYNLVEEEDEEEEIIPVPKTKKVKKPKVELIEEEDEEEEIIPIPKKQKSNKVPEPEAKQIVSSSIEEEKKPTKLEVNDLLEFIENGKKSILIKKIDEYKDIKDNQNNKDYIYDATEFFYLKTYDKTKRDRFFKLPLNIRLAINDTIETELRKQIRKETGSKKRLIDTTEYFKIYNPNKLQLSRSGGLNKTIWKADELYSNKSSSIDKQLKEIGISVV